LTVKLLIAIPVYNEERHLPRVLDAVRRHLPDVLVVDDGSTDKTAAILSRQAGVHTIRHPENRGYGQSLIDAFAFAAVRDYSWVITIDCDEQHEPAQIPEFMAAAAAGDCDVISGSRYLRPDAADDPAPEDRLRINRVINELLAQLVGLRLTDSFCGFKAHRVAAMKRLRLDEPGYAFPLQFWAQCARAGLRIRELPVRRIYRDPTREFGGTFDDPAARLQHYLEVLLQELRREPAVSSAARSTACACARDR
jgi:glycosyltransferase involved in cell wall biosynthesis